MKGHREWVFFFRSKIKIKIKWNGSWIWSERQVNRICFVFFVLNHWTEEVKKKKKEIIFSFIRMEHNSIKLTIGRIVYRSLFATSHVWKLPKMTSRLWIHRYISFPHAVSEKSFRTSLQISLQSSIQIDGMRWTVNTNTLTRGKRRVRIRNERKHLSGTHRRHR